MSIDYSTTKPIVPHDYGDVHDPTKDPILLAMGITQEKEKRCWGAWVKNLNYMRAKFGQERGSKLFREALSVVWAQDRAGECRKPGAILNMKIERVIEAEQKRRAKEQHTRVNDATLKE